MRLETVISSVSSIPKIRWFIKKFATAYYKIFFKAVADPDKVIVVNINKIQYMKRGGISDLPRMPLYFNIYGIVNGNWDLQLIKIFDSGEQYAETDHFVNIKCSSIYEHFIYGTSWKNTELFNIYRERLKNGPVKGFHDFDLLEEYYAVYDKMFLNIKERGFLSRFEDASIRNINVLIGRFGEIIYTTDGVHRLCIAKIIGIEKIPVTVLCRHKKWQDLRDMLCCIKESDRLNNYSYILNHPDLQDL